MYYICIYRYAEEIATVHKQYPAEPFKFLEPSLVLEYPEGVQVSPNHEMFKTANHFATFFFNFVNRLDRTGAQGKICNIFVWIYLESIKTISGFKCRCYERPVLRWETRMI